MRSARFLLAIGALALTAHATPVTWSLSGVSFSDGSSATGSFVFDADTVLYSSINIVTTTPTVGGTFQFYCVAPCTGSDVTDTLILLLTQDSANDLTNTPAFSLAFAAPLTNAGGADSIISGIEALCSDGTCGGAVNGTTVSVNTGSVVSVAATPEPYSALAMATGLAAIFALRYGNSRRRSSRI
jgi:hypothetical protein